MKKVLKYVLLSGLLFGLASCGKKADLTGLNDAKDYYYQSIKDDKNSLASYELNSKVVVAGVSYDIAWSIEVKDGIASNVTLGELNDDGKYPVTILYDDVHASTTTNYTLTCTISDVDGNKVSFSLDRVVPEFKFVTHEEWLSACKADDGTVVNVKAYVIGVIDATSSSFTSMYLQDANGYGYYAYKPDVEGYDEEVYKTTEDRNAFMDENYPIGTEVVLSAEATTYNGQLEVNSGGTLKKTGNTAESKGVTLNYTNATEFFEKAVSNTDSDTLNDYQNCRVVIDNCHLGSNNGSYYYFTVGDSAVKFNVYDTNYFLSEDEKAKWKENWVTGYTASLSGIISVYSKTFQIYPDKVDFIKVTDTTIDPNMKVSETLSALSVPTILKANYDLDVIEGLVWSLPENCNIAKIEDNTLVYIGGKEDETVTLTATYTYESVTDSKDFAINVAKYEEDVTIYSVSEAIEIASNLEANTLSNKEYIVSGVVYSSSFNASHSSYTIWLTDGTKDEAFELYSVCMDESITDDYSATDALKGLTVVIKGYIQHYYSSSSDSHTYEIPYLSASKSPTSVAYTPIISSVYDSTYGLGNESSPFTVAGALRYASSLEANTISEKEYYVLGEVYSSTYNANHSSYTIYLTDGTNNEAFELYSVGMDLSITNDFSETDSLKGYSVLIKGYIQHYYNTNSDFHSYEIPYLSGSKSPTLVAYTPYILKVYKDGKDINEKKEESTSGSGTKDDPFNVTEALEIATKLAENTISEKEYYVTGVVTSSSYNANHSSFTLWLTDGNNPKAFEVYSAVLGEGISNNYEADDSLVGATIIVSGYMQHYYSSKSDSHTYEIPFLYADKNPTGIDYVPVISFIELKEGGGESNPTSNTLSVAQALEICMALGENAISENTYIVSGVVTSSTYNETYKSYTLYLTDGTNEKAFHIYSAALASSITEDYTADNALVGKTIIVSGYMQHYVSGDYVEYEIPFISYKKSPTGNNFSPTILAVL